MSRLSHANLLFRQGKIRESIDIFNDLRRLRPGFTPYEQGYALACKRLNEMPPDNTRPEERQELEAIHPESCDIGCDSGRLFVVVTAVLNGEKFIETT